jgi:hypothetical protein
MMPANVDHEHAWRPASGEPRGYVCACGETGHRQRDDSIVASMAAIADPDDVVTARPTDDETINEYGRRLALIPEEYREGRWPDELALDF